MPVRSVTTASFLALFAVFAAGCGGGGGGSMPAGAVRSAAANLSVPFSITIPQLTPGAHRRSPLYISAATKSAVISYAGTRSIANCTTTCSATLSVPPGTVTFAVGLYDGAGGTGNLLSSGSTTAVIQTGQSNVVAISFGGVPAKLALSLGSTAGSAGTAATIPVIVAVQDAAGLTIVGPDPYTTPISLADDDTSGTTVLSAAVAATPNDQITLRYNGGSAVGAAHITASVPGGSIASQSASFTIRTNSTPPPNSGAYGAAVLAASPLGYYRLNDSSSTLTDSGRNGLNGAYGGSVRHGTGALTSDTQSASATFAGAPAGSAIAANSATVAANATFGSASVLSVEAWVKPAVTNTTNAPVPLVSYGRQAQGQAWVIQLTPQSTLQFWFKSVSGTYGVKTTSALQPGQIYHVVATYDGARAIVYVNGAVANSGAATGAVNYAGITSQYGLGIGAALGSTEPIFNGAISDVAVYSSALSAAVVFNHYLTGHLQNVLTETPVSSDAFVDTIGVNTHLSQSSGPYAVQWPQFQTLMAASGIRHIRDSLAGTPAWYSAHLSALAQNGVHATLSTDLSQTSSQIAALLQQYNGIVEAVAAPNEPDDGTDPNWVADTQAFQRMLYSTVKSNPATASLPVIVSPLVSQADMVALGNLSAYTDYGNIHDYLAGNNPGTAGWGSVNSYGTYGSIAWNRNVAGIISGSKPVIATEAGYGDYPTDPTGVDRRTLGRYIPRLYFEQFLNNIPRTTIYEFYDEGSKPGGFSNYGLVDAAGNAKPSYTALRNLIGVLADPGPKFNPGPVSYVIGGNVNNVHHLLMEKRDGTRVLALWVETPSYNVATKTDIAVPLQAVTIQPSIAASTASLSSFDDLGNMTTSPVTLSGGVASIQVDDRVSVLTFR